MRQIIIMIVVALACMVGSIVHAADRPACASHVNSSQWIVIDPNIWTPPPINVFTTALTKYKDYYNTTTKRYELCFMFADPLEVPSTISFTGGTSPHIISPTPAGDVILYGVGSNGINLMPAAGFNDADPIIRIHDFIGGKVIIQNMTINGAANGIKVENTPVELQNVNLAGVPGGSGIELLSADKSVVQSSVIEGFDVGISVEASIKVLIGSSVATDFDKYAVEIKENELYGIQIISGSAVKFGFNKIYGNNLANRSHLDAVNIQPGANNDIVFPDMIPQIYENNEFMLSCEKDASEQIVSRKARFDAAQGEIQVYEVGQAMQAKELIGSCAIGVDGECDLTNLRSSAQLDPGECGASDYFVTAIYTNNGSSQLMTSMAFDDGGVIFVDSPGYDVPAEGAQAEGVTTMSGEAAAREINESSGGDNLGGGPGGCGAKTGASLIPNDISSTYAPSLGIWWIIFSIGILGSLRYAKVRRNSRRRR